MAESRNKEYFLTSRNCCRIGVIGWISSFLSIGVNKLREQDQEINLTKSVPFNTLCVKCTASSTQGRAVALRTGWQGD